MELSNEVEANLRDVATAGPVELRENGARVAPLSTLSWELRGSDPKPLLHLWSAQHNLTRRVLAITDQSPRHSLYLVAPAPRFHPATDRLLRMLTPQLDIVRVGLVENWRRGPSVVLRR